MAFEANSGTAPSKAEWRFSSYKCRTSSGYISWWITFAKAYSRLCVPEFLLLCGPEGIEGVSQPCYSRSAFLCSDATQGVTVAFATHSSYSWGLNFARALTARDWFFGSYFIFICWTVI